MNSNLDPGARADSLNELLSAAGLPALDPQATAKLDEYLALILRWNARMNLTAVRDARGIRSRHFVESIACARHLPAGIASLLDFGTGAGLPGIPIALCRPEISVTLAESQTKKAAFLQEAVRTLKLNSRVFADRAENLPHGEFDCVTLRAVDNMAHAVAAGSNLVKTEGYLAVMTTIGELPRVHKAAGDGFRWLDPFPLPGAEQAILALASRTGQTA